MKVIQFFTADHSLARVSITFIVVFAMIILAYTVVNEISISATDKKADVAVVDAKAAREQGRATFTRKVDEVLANQRAIQERQIRDSVETVKERMERKREIRSLKNTIIAFQNAEAARLSDTFSKVIYFPNELKGGKR